MLWTFIAWSGTFELLGVKSVSKSRSYNILYCTFNEISWCTINVFEDIFRSFWLFVLTLLSSDCRWMISWIPSGHPGAADRWGRARAAARWPAARRCRRRSRSRRRSRRRSRHACRRYRRRKTLVISFNSLLVSAVVIVFLWMHAVACPFRCFCCKRRRSKGWMNWIT